MSDAYKKKGSLSVSNELEAFLKTEVLPGLEISEDNFWISLETIIDEFATKNKALLDIRESMQEKIDAWYLSKPGKQQKRTTSRDLRDSRLESSRRDVRIEFGERGERN